jgi:hypothetical protein
MDTSTARSLVWHWQGRPPLHAASLGHAAGLAELVLGYQIGVRQEAQYRLGV